MRVLTKAARVRKAAERKLLTRLPSLRAGIGRLVTRKVDRLSCVRVRLGALLGADVTRRRVLGPGAEAFITGAAAAGHARLGPELTELNTLHAAHGSEAFGDALSRTAAFGRWRSADVRSILAAGGGQRWRPS